jgi:hypothetical protein
MGTCFAKIIAVVLLGTVLAGCTKCGWIWDDWTAKPKACRSDAPVN